MLELGHRSKFALCASGIFICYFYYGILQVRLTTFSLRHTDVKHIKARIFYPPSAHVVCLNVSWVRV